MNPINFPIPVILDTDIGTDIDDTWALAMLLNSPELDLKMVLTESGDTVQRASLTAKFLQVCGRADIPVGIGLRGGEIVLPQEGWLQGYNLSTYPGTVYQDGVRALADMVMSSAGPVTLICIGPLTNIAAALELEPRIAGKACIVGMQGSLRLGYHGKPEPAPEYNVMMDVPACRKVFSAPWPIALTPLDTCGILSLHGEAYRRVYAAGTPLTQALMENARLWAANCPWAENLDVEKDSSVLYDTVAIYLAYSEEQLQMEELGVRVTDDGFTVIDDQARLIRCATSWKDLPAFEDLLVARLASH